LQLSFILRGENFEHNDPTQPHSLHLSLLIDQSLFITCHEIETYDLFLSLGVGAKYAGIGKKKTGSLLGFVMAVLRPSVAPP